MENKIDVIVNMLMEKFNQIIEEDCLGDMMKFMDSQGVPYEHFLTGDDFTQNKNIRECFCHAYISYVFDNLMKVKDKVRSIVFDIGGRQ